MRLGQFQLVAATTERDIADAQAFRAARFGLSVAQDRDDWDQKSVHILIRNRTTGALACCYRLSFFENGELSQSYSAQFYGLNGLRHFRGAQMELGRFCLCPKAHDPDVLRLAWAALAHFVDTGRVTLLFGCSSFPGTNAEPFADALAYLSEAAAAPASHAPERRAPEVVPLGRYRATNWDKRRALQQMPPLLRSYVNMRGWVSDHAVIDRSMGTLHVFTGVETASIPEQRQQTLRGLRRSAQTLSGAA